MTAGTKIFTRQEGGFGRGSGGGGELEEGGAAAAAAAAAEKVPRFRLLSEGLPVVLPYIKPETIIDADIPALRQLLETYHPLLSAFGEAFQCDVGGRCACALLTLDSPFRCNALTFFSRSLPAWGSIC